MVDVLYFAWVRERIGIPRERVESDAATVGELVDELRARGGRYEFALSDLSSVRFAVDQELAELSTGIRGAREIAVFPPMTGG